MGEARRKEDYLMYNQGVSREAAKNIRATQGKVKRLQQASTRASNSALGVFDSVAGFLATRGAMATAIAAARSLSPGTPMPKRRSKRGKRA